VSVLANWLARQAPAALRRSDLLPAQRRALHAIQRCRTPALGGHRYRCAHCGGEHHGFHSCHHRACPRCGGAKTAAWTQKQTGRLLPVPYFLVTCTVPAALRPVFRARPEVLHDLFFTHAAAALQAVAAIPRHLGAELGMLAVLHTSGRQLQFHPHLHFIIPGGGLRPDRRKWRRCRRPDWFLPTDAIAATLRERFDHALRAAAPDLHAQLPGSTWREAWWVHIQPAGTGEHVVQYLARYVQHTAISDARIRSADDESVRFAYTDSRSGAHRELTLTAEEFLRRYLQHILPPGQHRIRYFGWLHPAAKQRRLIVETLLAVVLVVRAKVSPPPWHLRCPHCERFTLVVVGRLLPARAPPDRGPTGPRSASPAFGVAKGERGDLP
jgi:hypothetical protein